MLYKTPAALLSTKVLNHVQFQTSQTELFPKLIKHNQSGVTNARPDLCVSTRPIIKAKLKKTFCFS